MWKQVIADYFTFTRKERMGVIALLLLIVIAGVLPSFYHLLLPEPQYTYSQVEGEIATLQLTDSSDDVEDRKKRFVHPRYVNQRSASGQEQFDRDLFYFDPNTIAAAEWVALGVKPKTAATIAKYLDKGGSFRRPADIAKIWGISPALAERLQPYVRIAHPERGNEQRQQPAYAKPPLRKLAVAINTADTSDWAALPGIGPKLSARIVLFRERLGGFHSPAQVAETFGLADSTFQKIKPFLHFDDASIRRININSATIDELKAHPYLRYQLANVIVQYRTQHGLYHSVDDLRKIMLVTEEILAKAGPYLTVE